MILARVNTLPFEFSKKNFLLSVMQVLGGSLFLALCAQISVPLYFSPVPLSGQTFGIMLLGATMGSRNALVSVFAYLLEGCLGLPVFAGGGFGIMSLIGPRGGYFLGFLLQAYLVGWFIERQRSFQMTKIMPLLLYSCLLQLGLGVMWLSLFVTVESALIMGFYPFLMGETIKSFAIASYLKQVR